MKEDWFTLCEFKTFYDNILYAWQEVEFEEMQIGLNSNDSKKGITCIIIILYQYKKLIRIFFSPDLTGNKNEVEVINLDSGIKDMKANNKGKYTLSI